MMDEPRYSFHNDSQRLTVIAENSHRTVLLLEKIHYWVSFLGGSVIMGVAWLIARKNGWVS